MKSDWEPPVKTSVALETYFDEVKGQLAEIVLFKPRNNLPFEECQAIRHLRSNSDIIIKKADKRHYNGHYEHKRQNTGGSSPNR